MLQNVLIFACVLTADRYICDGNMVSIAVNFDSFLLCSRHKVSFPIVNAFCTFQVDIDVVFFCSIIDHQKAIFLDYGVIIRANTFGKRKGEGIFTFTDQTLFTGHSNNRLVSFTKTIFQDNNICIYKIVSIVFLS